MFKTMCVALDEFDFIVHSFKELIIETCFRCFISSFIFSFISEYRK